MTVTGDATASDRVRAMRPFLPAKDLALSRRFYVALGFQDRSLGADLSEMCRGDHTFLLQGHYVREWAENCMMHVLVHDLDAEWARIEAVDLGRHFGVAPPTAPEMQPWGLRVAFVRDPAGVLWHYAEVPKADSASE